MSTERINQNRSTSIADWLTLERLLYGGLLGVAAFMRFFALGGQPLTTSEAATSWIAWISALGLRVAIPEAQVLADAMPPTSPLFYSLQGMLFWVAGGSDVLARFWPAMAGTALVLVAWYLRQEIGRYTALIMALLLAIEPWLVAYSRLADGTILSALFGLMALAALSTLSRPSLDPGRAAVWRTTGLISLGLTLVSGPQGWSFALVLLGFVLRNGATQLLSRLGIELGQSDLEEGNHEPVLKKATIPNAAPLNEDDDVIDSDNAASSVHPSAEPVAADLGIPSTAWALSILIGTALIGATGWLAFPEGLSYLATSLTTWVSQLTGDAERIEPLYSLTWVLLRLVVDQPLLLIFGLLGLLGTWLRYDSETESRLFDPLFLTGWVLFGVILLVLPGRAPYSLLMLKLPLLLAAARLGGRLLEAPERENWHTIAWREIQLISFMVIILVVLGSFVTASQINKGEIVASLLLTILLVAGLVTLLFVVLALMAGWSQARWVAGLASGIFLLLLTVSSSWQLNHWVDPLSPNGFFDTFTSSEARLLAENIRTLSAHQIGDPEEIPVHVEIDAYPEPLLAWYLRNMRNLTWSPSPASGSQETKALMLTFRGSVTSLSASEAYMGSDYELRHHWLPDDLPKYQADPAAESSTFIETLNRRWQTQLKPLARWIVYRKIDQMPPSETVILWTSGM